MDKIIAIVWSLFITSELFIIFMAYYYLIRQYTKACSQYSKKINHNDAHSSKKKSSQKSIIKINTTRPIDVESINQQIGYAELNFIRNGNCILNQIMSQKKLLIGRDIRNDISINDSTVSRLQCSIYKKDDSFILKNFAEKNFTRLNGKWIKNKAELTYGDVITMGKIILIFNRVSEELPPKKIVNNI